MAEIKTPGLIEIDGHRVYRVPVLWMFSMHPGHTCEYCPFASASCSRQIVDNTQCGLGYRLVKEDAWLKMKLRNS